MKFWDSSAVVPLLIEEETTVALLELFFEDPGMIAWWGTSVECAAALSRREREGQLDSTHVALAFRHLDALSRHWNRVEPVDAVLETARRLVRVHPLRAADSFQLAAAIAASEGRPSSLELVCLDDRLVSVAQREGFQVIDRSGFDLT